MGLPPLAWSAGSLAKHIYLVFVHACLFFPLPRFVTRLACEAYVSANQYVYIYVRMSLSLSLSLSVCRSVCLCVYKAYIYSYIANIFYRIYIRLDAALYTTQNYSIDLVLFLKFDFIGLRILLLRI